MNSWRNWHLGVKNSNLSKIACELLQLVKGWSNLVSNRIIIWRLPLKYHPNYQPKGFETLEEAREWVQLVCKMV